MNKKKHWYDYLWIWSIVYFSLGFFNILFAWLGMIDFIVPLIFAIAAGNKGFCNRYCGRGQLFNVLGKNVGCSRNKKAPRFLATKWFRYGFLVFFLTMFGNMLFQTWLVASGAESLKEVSELPPTYALLRGGGFPAGCPALLLFLPGRIFEMTVIEMTTNIFP